MRFNPLHALILLVLIFSPIVHADVRISALSAGYNGDSKIQYLELLVFGADSRAWGPLSNSVGKMLITSEDVKGNITSRYVFSSDAPLTGNSILLATNAFANLEGVPIADIIIPSIIPVNGGRVCFTNNEDFVPSIITVKQCVSYGGFLGNSGTEGTAIASDLGILGAQALKRSNNNLENDVSNGNLDFTLGVSSPQNSLGSIGTHLFVAKSLVEQGKTLFNKETFNGNGRRCGTCHIPPFFNLTPTHIAQKTVDDPLFVFTANKNINKLVVSTLSTQTGYSQPSDLIGVVQDGSGNQAEIVAGSGSTYLVRGGRDLTGLVSDSFGNSGTFVSLIEGDLPGPNTINGSLNGLEDPTSDKLLKSVDSRFPSGRALVLANVDGFSELGVFRKATHLINIKETAPYGMSGEFPTLADFTNGAVKQHFTHTLSREDNIDFRLPTSEETDALVAFQESITMTIDSTYRPLGVITPPNLGVRPALFKNLPFGNVTTYLQMNGAVEFVGLACVACHAGKNMNEIIRPLDALELLDTGVANLEINNLDSMPSEPPSSGFGLSTRKFSTPSLIGVRHTSPYFHDNSAPSLSDAIELYNSTEFKSSVGRHLGLGSVLNLVGFQFPEKTKLFLVEFLKSLSQYPFTYTTGKYFGLVTQNASNTEQLSITNTSNEILRITKTDLLMGQNLSRIRERISNLPPTFKLSTNPNRSTLDPYVYNQFLITPNLVDIEIQPNSTLNFDITFSPTIAGDKRFAQLEMQLSNSQGLWDFAISLAGEINTVSDNTPPTFIGPEVDQTQTTLGDLSPLSDLNSIQSPTLVVEATAALTTIKRPKFIDNTNSSITYLGDLATSTVQLPVGDTLQQGTISDSIGNEAAWRRLVSIKDTRPPSISASSIIEITTDAIVLHDEIPIPTVTDRASATFTIVHNGPDVFPTGDTLIEWTATDESDNKTTKSQTVRVIRLNDTTPPVFKSLPLTDLNIEATGLLTNFNLSPPAVSDDSNIVLSPTIDNNGPFALGKTLLTWTATDTSGNATSATQQLTIVDTTPPNITGLDVVTIEASGNLTSTVLPEPSATDEVEVKTLVHDGSGSYSRGETLITWKATDQSGNFSTFQQTLIIKDTVSPICQGLSDANLEATGLNSNLTLDPPKCTDALGIKNISNDHTGAYPIGSINITWTVIDESLNSVTLMQTIIVKDTTPPSLTIPQDITIETENNQVAISDLGSATASDLVGVASVKNDSTGTFPIGDNQVVWVAEDLSGNKTTKIQNIIVKKIPSVIVVDILPPSCQLLPDLMIEASGLSSTVSLNDPVCTDASGIAEVSVDHSNEFEVGTIIINWTVKDVSGNMVQLTQNVIVQDTLSPELVIPDDITMTIDKNSVAIDLGEAVATDAVGISFVKNDSDSIFAIGEFDVTWVAEDLSGNQTIKIQKVIIKLEQLDKPINTPTAESNDPAAEEKSSTFFGSNNMIFSIFIFGLIGLFRTYYTVINNDGII